MSNNLHARLITCLRFSWLLVGPCLTVLACGGCGKVKKPTSDSTLPSLVWNVCNLDTNQHADHQGSPTINAKRGTSLGSYSKANDPEGVKSIQINPSLGSGELAWGCKDPPGGESLGNLQTATLGPMTQNFSPDSDGYVLTRRIPHLRAGLYPSMSKNWTFNSGTAKLTGSASNYFGGIATEKISFIVSP